LGSSEKGGENYRKQQGKDLTLGFHAAGRSPSKYFSSGTFFPDHYSELDPETRFVFFTKWL
jgi:hypothetical protein